MGSPPGCSQATVAGALTRLDRKKVGAEQKHWKHGARVRNEAAELGGGDDGRWSRLCFSF